jgi:acyl-CoA synthetase (NDP forming)
MGVSGKYAAFSPRMQGIQLNLHEYQSKALFAEYGIPVPEGRVAQSPHEAARAASVLGGNLWVVKAQVHAGGRGKAGGVKLSRSVAEVEDNAKAMLGTRLVTHQSGAEGLPINHVYVEAGSDIGVLAGDLPGAVIRRRPRSFRSTSGTRPQWPPACRRGPLWSMCVECD